MDTDQSPFLPYLVAHRGLAATEIENTAPALEAAVAAGARHIEVDVQLSRDGIPVLYHDRDMQRLAGMPGPVSDHDFTSLATATLQQQGRPSALLTPLGYINLLLGEHPHLHAFVELKRIAIDRFGSTTMLDTVTGLLWPVMSRCTLISYDYETLLPLKQRGLSCGWVTEGNVDSWLDRARELQPDYVFVDIEDISLPLPDAPWQWVVFEVTDPHLACQLIGAGNTLVESFDIAGLDNSLGPDCLP